MAWGVPEFSGRNKGLRNLRQAQWIRTLDTRIGVQVNAAGHWGVWLVSRQPAAIRTAKGPGQRVAASPRRPGRPEILGDPQSAEVFLPALDGQFAEEASEPVLLERETRQVTRFAPRQERETL